MNNHQVTSLNAAEAEPHIFVAFASDLGLPPGEWPLTLTTNLGNEQPLTRTSKKVGPNGDLVSVTYRQQLGCIALRVFND